MIAQLKGTVVALEQSCAVLDVGGVGFAVNTTSPTLAALSIGCQTVLHTQLIVRDDALTLYGFSNSSERRFFENLIAVSGVGPKVALGLLSSFASEDLQAAIARGDAQLIATAPGIGKKTAQRIIVELKGAFEAAMAEDSIGQAAPAGQSDVTDALLGMGFTAAEAALAIKGFAGEPTDSNALLRHALKRLGS